MFLRCHSRKKNGKRHRYWSVVESRRCRGGRPVQRQVLYLGEINDSQEAAWRKTIEVFDERKKQYEQLSLFPSDRPIPPDEVNALSVVLTDLRLRPRVRSGIAGWDACGGINWGYQDSGMPGWNRRVARYPGGRCYSFW